MPRLDRFVDPLHHGIDYMKHRVEDMYDQGMPQQKSSWFSNLFGGSRSYQQQPSYTAQMGQYGARKLGKKIAQTFTGHPQEQHGGMFSGYGQHRGGIFGYGEEEPSFFEHPIEWIESNVFNRTLGPVVFVAWPLILGLFISSWSHKQIRNNRAWYDKITLPNSVPSSWLYDPMWTLVLTCMGYASFLVFEEGGFGNWLSLGAYNLSLFALVAWPLAFFGLHDSIAAPIIASILTGLFGLTSVLFFFQSGVAGCLMTLATAWVGYMTVVNWQVHSRNAGLSRVGKEKGDWPWSSTATSGVSAAGAAVPTEAREAKKVR